MTTYNGITLRADSGPYIVTAISPTQHFYTDTALSTAVTLPAKITTTTTWYCAAAYAGMAYTFTVLQPDGTDISPGSLMVGTTGDTFLRPQPSAAQIGDDTSGFPFGMFRVIKSGDYYGPAYHTPGTAAAGTGVLTLVPFWSPATFAADRLGVAVTTAAATAVARLGIYAANRYDEPDTLLLDAGTVDATSNANVEATIDYTFTRGLYYLACVSQVASATLRTVGSASLPPVRNATLSGVVGSSAAINCYYKTGVTGALADLSTLTGSGSAGYKVVVRAA